ncbi:MAG TPA: imidazolonepropionase, partial [Bacteroidia bacterium]|nr:imidazolonepropionase [Bacteroidia bacterium]
MKILIKNIKSIIRANPTVKGKVSGAEMASLPCITNGWITIEGHLISGVGEMKEGLPTESQYDHVINAEGRFAF